MVSGALTSTFTTKTSFMIFFTILFLFVGCIMDTSSAIIILTPLLLPAAKALGIDPIHFGMLMIVNLAIGFVTPPVGVNLYLGMQISGSKLGEAVKFALPMILIEVAILVVLTFVPQIAMWLPNLVR